MSRLLIVEDDAVLRKLLTRLFLREGFEVATASSCAEAIAEITGQRFEAVLLDLQLPDGDGLDMLERFDATRRPRHAIVMTAHATPESRARAQSLHVARLLAKPMDLRELLLTVRGVSCVHVAAHGQTKLRLPESPAPRSA